MKRVIISAPFGNYFQPEGTTPTLGTFTLHERKGRLWRILKTCRYNWRLKSWTNRIGLRNPGIQWLRCKVKYDDYNISDKIISVHGFTVMEWQSLIALVAAMKPLAIELNVSCPNVRESSLPQAFYEWCMLEFENTRFIVKLPPVNWQTTAIQAVSAGVKYFHCCNTLPTPAGGLSGQVLKPVARDVCRALHLRNSHVQIIGGGGITEAEDIYDYRSDGCNYWALGTGLLGMRRKTRQRIILAANSFNIRSYHG